MKSDIVKPIHGGNGMENEEARKDEERPVRWMREGANTWRIVYAD